MNNRSISEADWCNNRAFLCKSVKIGRGVDHYKVISLRSGDIRENFCISGYLNIKLAHFFSLTNDIRENIFFARNTFTMSEIKNAKYFGEKVINH